ncbi:MAG TPA: sigma-54 dependent transcriptional regulator [Bryobacteraceae bacterium]|nr:sigma-54 dependent transcriptional regulator [Bryobacteraceae bacterium]
MDYLETLCDEEAQPLRPLLKSLLELSEPIIEHWAVLYRSQCGERRALQDKEFSSLMSPFFGRGVAALLGGDFDSFVSLGRSLGAQLAKRAVPFIEVILALHLCQESIESVCAADMSADVETSLAKFCHVHAALVAEGYLWQQGNSAIRTEATEYAPEHPTSFFGMLGASSAMRRVYERIGAVAHARGTVLIVGESGTGKELAARAIHKAGMPEGAPFVAVNCPAIPRDLIESELFGHKRGAFSGANLDHIGLFRAAEGGTLLLDEVTEMSLDTQSKLLRVLQEYAVRPVGSTVEVPVNVRVIAATNRQPEEAVRLGLLRQDLYYRLQAAVIEIPPLRERREDIPLLVSHFIKAFGAQTARSVPITGVAQEAMAVMLRYQWPGNVRELANAIESAVIFSRSSRIRLKDLPAGMCHGDAGSSARARETADTHPAADSTAVLDAPQSGSIRTFDETERELIERTLAIAGHNKTYAAELLRISRKKLYARMAKYGLVYNGRRLRRGAVLSERPTV